MSTSIPEHPKLNPADNTSSFNLHFLLPLLAAIIAITPLSIDLYLPALSTLAISLNTSMTVVQQSLSVYLAGYALGMLCFGPLADRFGRRRLVLFGLSSFIVTSLALAFVTHIEFFLSLRFFQAFFGAAATVVVPGYIKEIYGKNTAKGMSYVSMIMMLAPLVGPSVGSLILTLGQWHLIFYVLSLYALLLLLLVIFKFNMPSDKDLSSRTQRSFLGSYATVFSKPGVKFHIASGVLASFAFFCYLTAAPFVYMQVFGLDKSLFAILFSTNVGSLMLANFINSKFVGRFGSKRILRFATVLGIFSASILMTVNLLSLNYWYTVIAMAPLMASIGTMNVNIDALVLMKFKKETGTATAVMGTLRFAFGATAGPLLAFFYTGTAVPFTALMLSAIVLVALCQLLNAISDKTATTV